MKLTELLKESPLTDYGFIGNIDKSKRFDDVDKKLIQHPVNNLKAIKFFEKTPYNFRVFMYGSGGKVNFARTHKELSEVDVYKLFNKPTADTILNASQNAITIIYNGNWGDGKVMLTPWVMAHRFGHTIQDYDSLGEAEFMFDKLSSTVSKMFGLKHYGDEFMVSLGHALGTQKSSRLNNLTDYAEFTLELFAQYIGTGKITLNPIPTELTVDGKTFKTEAGLDTRAAISAQFSKDVAIKFDKALATAVGNIYII